MAARKHDTVTHPTVHQKKVGVQSTPGATPRLSPRPQQPRDTENAKQFVCVQQNYGRSTTYVTTAPHTTALVDNDWGAHASENPALASPVTTALGASWRCRDDVDSIRASSTTDLYCRERAERGREHGGAHSERGGSSLGRQAKHCWEMHS